MPIVQHLKKYIEYIRMCFLNLIKQNHGIWMCTHLVTELSTFFMTDISRRGSDHLRNRMFLHIF